MLVFRWLREGAAFKLAGSQAPRLISWDIEKDLRVTFRVFSSVNISHLDMFSLWVLSYSRWEWSTCCCRGLRAFLFLFKTGALMHEGIDSHRPLVCSDNFYIVHCDTWESRGVQLNFLGRGRQPKNRGADSVPADGRSSSLEKIFGTVGIAVTAYPQARMASLTVSSVPNASVP